MLLVEDLRAAPLASALDRSGGLLIEGARIPLDLADAAAAAPKSVPATEKDG